MTKTGRDKAGVVTPANWRRTARAFAFASALLALGGPLQVARAQSYSTEILLSRIERLERDLAELQRQVDRGGTAAVGQDLPDSQAARIELRLNAYESELKRLTGEVEELSFRLRQVENRVSHLGTAPASPAMAPVAGGMTGSNQPTGDTGPKVLGTVPQAEVDALQSQEVTQESTFTAAAPAASLPEGSPQQQYDYARSLLKQADWAGAEGAFQAFLGKHPNDPLAGNAKYWLGETYYVRGDYATAAVVFAEGFESYPNSPKAPDNLLKLGMALGNLGRRQDACGTLTALQQRYPDASKAITARAGKERARLGC
jgi:tol-pal system protein YbgF